MKVKDVTSKEKLVVKIIKLFSQRNDSSVKVYENDTTRFIHETRGDKQTVSISRVDKPVTEKECSFAIKKIMKKRVNDVEVMKRPSGVVFIQSR